MMNRLSQTLKHYIDPDFLAVLKQKYNILDVLETKYFDKDVLCNLENIIQSTKKQVYDPKDRYIVILFDIYFYADNVNLFLYNFVKVWKYLDIPAYTLVFYTNHFGITKEIEKFFADYHISDRPMVIETFYNPDNFRHQDDSHKKFTLDNIKYHILGLLSGTQRVHRHVFYNFLNKNCPKTTALSITAYNEK